MPPPAKRGQLLFYRVARDILAAFCRVYLRQRLEGTEHLPEGPFVLAPVHRSNIDTPLVCAVTKRRLRFMGKETVWKYRQLGWALNALGGFPVHRGHADREALKRCLEVLDGGEPLVLFPEGTRQTGPLVKPLFEGAAYVATRAGVPIVPVGIGGSARAMPKGARMPRPVRVHLIVGEPILPDDVGPTGRASRRAVHALSERLRGELQRLFEEAEAKAGA
ncbi:MAG: 1-acyl-sn-glycerol-3-phosphate acyltransferase [Actinomycetota bacterium]|nr:1-acyl-sn-glycerol-3-phosphate acyltransferase [Actinomycetota bacterium]